MSPSREPGWYRDSVDPARERWWDGGEWSHVTRPAKEPPAPQGRASWRTPTAPPAGGPGYAPPRQPYASQPGWGHRPSAPWSGQDPYGRPARPVPTTPDGVPLADVWLRLLARLLDYVVTTTASMLIGLPFLVPIARELDARLQEAVTSGAAPSVLGLVNEVFADVGTRRWLMLYQAVALLVNAVYTVTLVRARGATLGKLAVGVRVRAWDREGHPTWGQSFTRWLTREGVAVVPYLGLVYWLLDGAWPLADPRRQGLHDKLPGTVVVRAR